MAKAIGRNSCRVLDDLAIRYCGWQRGTNDNTNGLQRQFFSNGSDMMHAPVEPFENVQLPRNNRPRKRLGCRTPVEKPQILPFGAIET